MTLKAHRRARASCIALANPTSQLFSRMENWILPDVGASILHLRSVVTSHFNLLLGVLEVELQETLDVGVPVTPTVNLDPSRRSVDLRFPTGRTC